jgi:hypothetical protein
MSTQGWRLGFPDRVIASELSFRGYQPDRFPYA